jgi:sterol desaturase/sphingolipid hydroxylase (fatty acid hydroxylase superfamily)
MHVPANRWFERTKAFKFSKEHHRIHHKYMNQNLNVFLPIADRCLGTYRSISSVNAPGSGTTDNNVAGKDAVAQIQPKSTLSRKEA